MRVYIGPYKNWFGPYQIAEKILFWMDKYEDDRVHAFGTWLADDKNGNDSWLTKVCQWINRKKQRKIKIRIDRYDTWSMDHTLALITLPMLKQLKATAHGSAYVDPEDVPEHLRPDPERIKMSEEGKIEHWEADNTVHDRWNWYLIR